MSKPNYWQNMMNSNGNHIPKMKAEKLQEQCPDWIKLPMLFEHVVSKIRAEKGMVKGNSNPQHLVYFASIEALERIEVFFEGSITLKDIHGSSQK